MAKKMSPTLTDTTYKELAKKMVKLIYSHFEDGTAADFLMIAKCLGFAYFSVLSSQIENDPKFENKISIKQIIRMSNSLTNFTGHLLAMENIAAPTTTKE